MSETIIKRGLIPKQYKIVLGTIDNAVRKGNLICITKGRSKYYNIKDVEKIVNDMKQ